MLTREQHFSRLNNYRNSCEYDEHTSLHGMRPASLSSDKEPLPSLLGKRWEISERIYNEFLEMLPPLNWRGSSFLMREFCFSSITTKYTQEGGEYYKRYFCEFVDITKEPA